MFFSTRLGERLYSATAVARARPRIAEDRAFETAVDQTLMRGLDTARPRVLLRPASLSSRASNFAGHEITSRIARRARASGDPRKWLHRARDSCLPNFKSSGHGGYWRHSSRSRAASSRAIATQTTLVGLPALTSRRYLAPNPISSMLALPA
jgi:hypothetical protein